MERIVIHCHCKEAIEGLREDLKEIKEILAPKCDNSVIMDTEEASTSKESDTEQVDEEIKKVPIYCFHMNTILYFSYPR